MKRSILIMVIAVLGVGCSSASNPSAGTTAGTTPTQSTAALSTSSGVTAPPRVTCAAGLPQVVASGSDLPRGSAPVLVGIPATRVLVCRYAPLDTKVPNALVGFGESHEANAVRRLLRQTNALHQIPNAERIPCPLNPSTPGWSIAFSDSASTSTLVVSASDCGFVTNGSVTAGPTDAWLATLGRIANTRAPAPAVVPTTG